MKKNLVIVPTSGDAQFINWGDYSKYNFDLAVITWQSQNIQNTVHAKYVEYFEGQKWHIINKFSEKHDITEYKYIWVLDDDCIVDPAVVEKIFEFCQEYNLDLAQPALSLNSYRSHASTLLVPGNKMHITDTVEIMCPIFSQRAWPDCSRHFGKMPLGIGYGMEGYWRTILESANGTTKYGGLVGVIDQYPVYHSKPVSGPHYYASKGLNPDIDGNYFYHLGYRWEFNTLQHVKNNL